MKDVALWILAVMRAAAVEYFSPVAKVYRWIARHSTRNLAC